MTLRRPRSYDGFQAPRPQPDTFSSRRRVGRKPRSSRRWRRPPGRTRGYGENLRGRKPSRDDTGCPRCSKEGTSPAGSPAKPSLRGRDPCCVPVSPDTLHCSLGSFRTGSTFIERPATRVELRESDSREIDCSEQCRDMVLRSSSHDARGVSAGATQVGSTACETRTEAAASRGRRSRAPVGVPVRRQERTAEVGDRVSCHVEAFVRLLARARATRAVANLVGAPLAHESEREPTKAKGNFQGIREA